ncbi:MAG: Transmembrane exosortase [Bacteroidetes bacterium OLB12]|nr:MAG: Transmembrane exosortase [Bacteroidetes bacterium OLB12]
MPKSESTFNKWLYSKDFQKERKLFLFFLKLFVIWLSWKGIFFILGEEKMPLAQRIFPSLSALWEEFNMWVIKGLLLISKAILNVLGYNSHITERSIWIEQVHAVGVGNYCLGMQLIYYNTLLILITPASWVKKTIAIIFGIVITQVMNIIRITGLALLALHKPEWIEFAHDHIFNVMVFGTMIGFYYFYVVRKNNA